MKSEKVKPIDKKHRLKDVKSITLNMRDVGFFQMIKRDPAFIHFAFNMISSFEFIIFISEICRLLETKVKYRLHYNV